MADVDPVLGRHLQYLRQRHLAASYIDQRRRILLALMAFTDRPLLEITTDDLDRWQELGLAGRTTGRSRNTVVSHVRSFYHWAHALEEVTPDDRGRRLVRAKTARLLPRPIGREALLRALEHAPHRVRPMLYLAAFEGLRAVEIAGLRSEDLRTDVDPPTLVVLGKGSKERILPLSPVVLEALQAHGLPERGHVFRMWTNQGPTSRQITAHRVSAACNGYLAEVGARATLHQLRHFFGSSLYMASRDLRLTQEAMGHSSPATTAGYAAFEVSETAGYMVMITSALQVSENAVRSA